MAMYDALVYRSADRHAEDGYLPQDELKRRVAARFPLAVIDRERGDQYVRDQTVRLIELSAPDVVLKDWRSHEGRVAYVTIRGKSDGPQFEFFLFPNPNIIEIVYKRPEDRDACRPLLEELAEVLPEFDIMSEDLEDDNFEDEDLED
ncbi:MAG: hypothetical protein U0798_19845 [Gemmataceae bacterium]